MMAWMVGFSVPARPAQKYPQPSQPMQAQFPLRSGRILGLPGRILQSAMGLVVAALSVTGVVIWHRKRRARISISRRRAYFDERATAGSGACGMSTSITAAVKIDKLS
jgi:uncharacterized iron-regulated membrane protein